MTKPLLIEVGVEELPAIPFLKELPNIEKKWNDILEEYQLSTNFDFYYTPRRLVLWHNEFAVSQEDSLVEQYGAPVAAGRQGRPAGSGAGRNRACAGRAGLSHHGHAPVAVRRQPGRDQRRRWGTIQGSNRPGDRLRAWPLW